MCKTLIYSAIQYYRDDHAYWYKNLSKPQYIELSDVYVNIRFKKIYGMIMIRLLIFNRAFS